MTITLILFAGAAALELLVHLFSKWQKIRTVLALAALGAGGFTAGMLVATRPNLFTMAIALISMYRVFNMIRMLYGRMHEEYLRNATRTTTLSLLGLQAVMCSAWLWWERWQMETSLIWLILAIAQLTIAVILLVSVVRTLRKTVWPAGQKHYSDRELPTVTIAIPARNETEDLEQCLQSVIGSDYPKLEVIVLDDCSQTKRTPEIIKDFAQDGVRFIQGREPAETWLPKNQAYARLTEEASGEYILFCGVDTRFERQSIRKLVTTMLDRQKQMLCVLPRRQASAYGHASLIQAMRYWWELVPPRRSFRRPPVLSSCWIIKRAALRKAGGFAAVARAIVPEAYFAKSVLGSDGYSFLRSTDGLGISSNKGVADQRNTAVRMRYPQMHKRPEQVAMLTLTEAVFLLLPFVIAIAGFWIEVGTAAHVLAVIASVMLIVTYELLVLSTHVNAGGFGVIGQPLAVLTDIALLHYSMWKYELSIVDWKGRNVCVPVMHVVSHLPRPD